jgi:hypothetical protein
MNKDYFNIAVETVPITKRLICISRIRVSKSLRYKKQKNHNIIKIGNRGRKCDEWIGKARVS